MIHPDALITPREAANDFDDYASMTKEQLIKELMKARIRENYATTLINFLEFLLS